MRKAKSSLYSSKGLPTTLPPELIISKHVCVYVFIYLENYLFNSSISNLDLEISFYSTSMVSTFVKSFPKVSATNHSNIWVLQHLIFSYTMGLITFHHEYLFKRLFCFPRGNMRQLTAGTMLLNCSRYFA